ncbi:MAG: hypothetical protein WBY94_00820, partial [Polyangiaceae bacterium]
NPIKPERAKTRTGEDVYWARQEINLEPIAPPDGFVVSEATWIQALRSEIAAWNEATACALAPHLRLLPVSSGGAARDDGRNVVTLITKRWCPADARGDLAACYDPRVQSITHVRTRTDRQGPSSGEIHEVDIEVNAVDFRWSLDGDEPGTRSLRAVLGHELGHVLGLAHACGDAHARETIGSCSPGAIASIMYPDPTEPGRRRVLAPDRESAMAVCTPPSQSATSGSCTSSNGAR